MKKRSKASSKNNNTSIILFISTVIILLSSILFVAGKDQIFSTLLLGKVIAKEGSNQFKDSQSLQDFIEKPDKIKAENTARQLEVATFDMVRTLNNYLISKDKKNEKRLQELALSRKKLLVEVMRNNPDAALQSIMPSEVRDAIATICKDCVEVISTVEGTLEVLHVDFFDEGISKESYTLITKDTKDKKRIRLHPTFGLKESLVSGTKIKVKGLQVDNELLFDGTDSLSEPTGDLGGIEILESVTDSPPVYGDQKTLVLMVNFQNIQPPTLTQDNVQTIMDDTNNYYQENSYNQVYFSGVIDPTKSADVLGWYTMPIDQTCNSEITDEATRISDPDVNFNEYSRLIIVAPFGPDCSWFGSSSYSKIVISTPDGDVSLSVVQVNSNSMRNYKVVAHELGHNFGVGHAKFIDCGEESISDSGCNIGEYGDIYDVMGNGKGHYNAIFKENLGWFSPNNIIQVTTSGTYTIEPIETTTEGPKALKFKRGIDDYLYIEYRQPIGTDTDIGIGTDVFQGAIIHIPDSSGFSSILNSLLIETTPPGNAFSSALLEGLKFTDPKTGTNITTIRNSQDTINPQNSRLTININICKTDFIRPIVSLNSSEPPFATISGNITLNATVNDDSGIEKVEFYWSAIAVDKILFATDAIPPYEAILDTTHTPNGNIEIFAIAYDLSGAFCNAPGNSNVSNPINHFVENMDDIPPNITIISPVDGAEIDNPISITAVATDNIGVYIVQLIVGLESGGLLPTYQYFKPPYNLTITMPIGQQGVQAQACDFVGNCVTSPKISFNVVDRTPPMVSIIWPINGSFKGNNFTRIRGRATDNTEVTSLEVYIDDNTQPLVRDNFGFGYINYVWNTSPVPDGPHTIKAIACDSSGNCAFSTIIITIDNTIPTFSWVSPKLDSIISGSTVNISGIASDNFGIQIVEFYLESISIGNSTAPPYTTTWNSTAVPDGRHYFYASVLDLASNYAIVPNLNVIVNNIAPFIITISNQTVIEGSLLSFQVNAQTQEGLNLDLSINNLYDLNKDRIIDSNDINYIAGIILENNPYDSRADLDKDGDVDAHDLGSVIATWQNGWSFRITNNAEGIIGGTFSWTPDNSQIGNHIVNFTVSDESGNSDSQVVTITVLAAAGGGGGGGGEPGKFII